MSYLHRENKQQLVYTADLTFEKVQLENVYFESCQSKVLHTLADTASCDATVNINENVELKPVQQTQLLVGQTSSVIVIIYHH